MAMLPTYSTVTSSFPLIGFVASSVDGDGDMSVGDQIALIGIVADDTFTAVDVTVVA